MEAGSWALFAAIRSSEKELLKIIENINSEVLPLQLIPYTIGNSCVCDEMRDWIITMGRSSIELT